MRIEAIAIKITAKIAEARGDSLVVTEQSRTQFSRPSYVGIIQPMRERSSSVQHVPILSSLQRSAFAASQVGVWSSSGIKSSRLVLSAYTNRKGGPTLDRSRWRINVLAQNKEWTEHPSLRAKCGSITHHQGHSYRYPLRRRGIQYTQWVFQHKQQGLQEYLTSGLPQKRPGLARLGLLTEVPSYWIVVENYGPSHLPGWP